MHTRRLSAVLLSTMMFLLPPAAGCGAGRSDVPGAVTVTLPDGTEQRVTLGSGVLSLADSEWDFFAVADNAQAAPFLRGRFNDNGSLRSFENNTLAQEVFGSRIVFDGQRHSTNQFGLEYTAAAYGAETEDGTGFAFEGRFTAFAAGVIEAAHGTAAATGTYDPDDANTVRGTFSYSVRVTIDLVPNGNQNDEFSFVAHRVAAE